MTFFLVAALHSAFSVPTTVESNWTFRVAHPRSTSACVHALGIALVVVAVLPVTLVWLVITASLWPWWQAVAAAAMHAASGVALAELTLIGRRSIPFTRAHAAAVQSVRLDWIFGLFALHLFAFRLDDAQVAALRSQRGVLYYLLAMAVVVAAARLCRRSLRAEDRLEFGGASARCSRNPEPIWSNRLESTWAKSRPTAWRAPAGRLPARPPSSPSRSPTPASLPLPPRRRGRPFGDRALLR